MEGGCLRYFLAFLLWMLCMRTIVGNNTSMAEFKVIKCIEREKQALLMFKDGLVDKVNRLSSWGSVEEDCCKWRGVRCNKKSGHVYELNLRPTIDYQPGGISYSYAPLEGEIDSSLLELRYLRYLDLSLFRGSGNSMPEFIGSLNNLRYLNLSGCSFPGKIPRQFGNLSSLVTLDLSGNFHQVESLMFLSHFLALKHLDMSSNNLSPATDWFQAINMLPSLLNLHLTGCQLSLVIPPSLSLANSSKSLAVIHLSENFITSSIFPWLLNFNNSLVSLDLEYNKLQGLIPHSLGALISLKNLNLVLSLLEGEIPRSFGNLCSLETLDLSSNNLTGPFPDLRNVSFITELHLSNNTLSWSLPESVGLLSDLEVLDLSSNSMSGVISDIHFSSLSKLWHLDISDNSFNLTFSSNWIPPFQLIILKTRPCILGPRFPQWLHTQKRLAVLDISNAGIADRISDRFWEIPPTLIKLNLSHNLISGEVRKLPSILGKFSLIDLSSNLFHGSLPRLPPDTEMLDLSGNRLSGTISSLCSISGENLNYLDLSDNLLSGELPDCWMNWTSLSVINLANNGFSGNVPASFGLLPVQTLHLRNNNFSGELSPALANCRGLMLLDLGDNRFSGRIPAWVGVNLTDLIVLRLKSNRFWGSIPLKLCHLASIQILDLSDNSISGSILRCLSNFTAMARKGGTVDSFPSATYSYPLDELNPHGWYQAVPYPDNVMVAWKGTEREYGKILGLVKYIDLSCNNLRGTIPGEIAALAGLISLNLSNNQLVGVIPRRIGYLSLLESLDLSANNLCGSIPQGLGELNFLSYLNLSNNNFSGKIPTSTQLQSFTDASFRGNSGLCGKPLPTMCPGEKPDHFPNQKGTQNVVMEEDGKDEIITSGFYISMGLGFATGFWVVCGTLLLYRPRRHVYFRFLDMVGRRLYIKAAVSIANLRRML